MVDRTKTVFGFLFTLLFYGLMGVGIFTFGFNYLDTTKPQTVQKEIQNSTVPTVKMNDDSGIYYLYLAKGPGGYINQPDSKFYFNFSLRYDQLSLNPNGTINRVGVFIPSQPCNATSWFSRVMKYISPKMQPIFQQYGLCADESYKNVTFYGALAPPYTAFTAGFGLCKLASGCKTDAELAQLSMSAYSIESHYDDQDVKAPLYLQEKLQVTFKYQAGYFLQERSIITDVQVATDVGIFSRSYDHQMGFQHIPPRFERRKLYPNDPYFAEFTVYTSGMHREYNRTYYKLLFLFSDLGGLIQIVAFVITLFYADYNKYVQTVSLIRHGVLGKKKTSEMQKQHQTKPINASQKVGSTNLSSTKLEMAEGKALKPSNPQAPTNDFIGTRSRHHKPTFMEYSQSRTKQMTLTHPNDLRKINKLICNRNSIKLEFYM